MLEVSEKYFPLIEKQLSSSLTVKEFCKANGLNHKTLYHWKKKYLERNKASVQAIKPGFTALSVVDVAKETEFIIQYPDGTRLTLSGSSSVAMVKQFLPAFKS
jgi:transposase-like protein